MKQFQRAVSLVIVAVMLFAMTSCGCNHQYSAPTCTTPAFCSKCGEIVGTPLGHQYLMGTCVLCGTADPTATPPADDDPDTMPDEEDPDAMPGEEDDKKPDQEPEVDPYDPTQPMYFNIPAAGDYSDGILLPELEDAAVTVMMSIDWSYLETNNNPDDPFAQFQATHIWRGAYAEQGGDVEIITISDEQQTDYLATQSASGTAPDIVNANYDMTFPRWSGMGLVANVSDYADYLDLDGGLYNTRLMEQCFNINGNSYAVITQSEPDRNYIVFNKTKFEQAGQATPLDLWKQGNWNWTQFVKSAKAMTSGDDYGFTGWGLFPYFAPYPMATLNGGQAALNIDDPKYMRYMTEVYNLYQVDKAARGDVSLQQWSSLFPLGTDAMVQTNKAGFKRIVESATRLGGDEFGIAPVPVFDPAGESQSIASASLWGYSISKQAKNPIGAAAYIRLETMVTRNIEKAFEGTTWFDQNLTADEKAMLEATANDPICPEMIRGIGNCYLGIIDSIIVPQIYYGPTQNSVAAIFDAQKNAMQAEFDDFNVDMTLNH